MKLTIKPLGSRSGYTWEIVYGEGEKAEVRAYELLPAAPAGDGHFVVDEKDGIKLDTYLVGHALISSFRVDNSLLTTRFERRGDSIVVEMATFDMASPITAKVGNNEISSYRRKALQTATLRRIKG